MNFGSVSAAHGGDTVGEGEGTEAGSASVARTGVDLVGEQGTLVIDLAREVGRGEELPLDQVRLDNLSELCRR